MPVVFSLEQVAALMALFCCSIQTVHCHMIDMFMACQVETTLGIL